MRRRWRERRGGRETGSEKTCRNMCSDSLLLALTGGTGKIQSSREAGGSKG